MSTTIDAVAETETTTIASQVDARAEAARIAEHQAALAALRRLGEPLEAPDPVLVIDMRVAQLVEVFDREWEEFSADAAVQLAVSAETLREARAASVAVYGERT